MNFITSFFGGGAAESELDSNFKRTRTPLRASDFVSSSCFDLCGFGLGDVSMLTRKHLREGRGLGFDSHTVQKRISDANCLGWEMFCLAWGRTCYLCIPADANIACPCCDCLGLREYKEYYSDTKVHPTDTGICSAPEDLAYGRDGELLIILSCPGDAHEVERASGEARGGLVTELDEIAAKSNGSIINCTVDFKEPDPRAGVDTDWWKAEWYANLKTALAKAKWDPRKEDGGFYRRVTYVIVTGGGAGCEDEKQRILNAYEDAQARGFSDELLGALNACNGIPDDNTICCRATCLTWCPGLRPWSFVNGYCFRSLMTPILVGPFCACMSFLACQFNVDRFFVSGAPLEPYIQYSVVKTTPKNLETYLKTGLSGGTTTGHGPPALNIDLVGVVVLSYNTSPRTVQPSGGNTTGHGPSAPSIDLVGVVVPSYNTSFCTVQQGGGTTGGGPPAPSIDLVREVVPSYNTSPRTVQQGGGNTWRGPPAPSIDLVREVVLSYNTSPRTVQQVVALLGVTTQPPPLT
eukprot:gene1046-3913_t